MMSLSADWPSNNDGAGSKPPIRLADRRYFFLSAAGSTQFVYLVVFVHWPIFDPLVSQAKTTHLSQTYFFPLISCETPCSVDSHLSSACAKVTPASVKEKSIASALMIFMIGFQMFETIRPVAATDNRQPTRHFQD
jgi:hypothetical protein